MASIGDPYRILGLPPGAPLAEVKRAYRRLAKANHPDTAGEAAIPRFLAIRAAYEALVGEGAPGGRRRPGEPGRPWDPDPERARDTREAWRSRAGRRPGADGDSAGADRPPAGDRPPRSRRRRGSGPSEGDRSNRRATPGSTSYDHSEPFDPEWTGASWYGQSSGTYWTINPKEYADPRKHGPEYQARGRRRPAAGERPQAPSDADDEAAGPAWTPPPPAAPPEPPPAQPPAGGVTTSFDPWSILAPPVDARSRLAVALLGWPPLGLALALVLGELSGCSRFSASCVETFGLGTWLGQVAIIGILVAVPLLAAASAVGSVTMLATAIPAAVLLSAIGGSRDPGNASAVLWGILAVAWAVGAGVALLRRSRTVPP